MKNFTIQLPKELHSIKGEQRSINFDLSKTYYSINGVKTFFDLKKITSDEIEYWNYNIMNKSILVTLYAKNDILK